MGEVKVKVKLSNFVDIVNAERGVIPKSEVMEIDWEMLVDTGAVMVLLPQDVIERLNLIEGKKVIVRYADERKEELRTFQGLKLKVENREGVFDCIQGPPNCEALLGQIVLEELDLRVNPIERKLEVNPKSPFLPSLKLK